MAQPLAARVREEVAPQESATLQGRPPVARISALASQRLASQRAVDGNAAGATICGADSGRYRVQASAQITGDHDGEQECSKGCRAAQQRKSPRSSARRPAIERGSANERGARTHGISWTAPSVARRVARSRAQSAHDVRCRSTSARFALLARPSRYGESNSLLARVHSWLVPIPPCSRPLALTL